LPKDTRTPLNTPRNKVILSQVKPGEYVHFNLETEIIEAFSRFSLFLPNCIEIDFHTDGCALNKLESVHLWPIQCRIANIKYIKPRIVGVYKSPTKPENPNFLNNLFQMLIKCIA